VAGRREREEEWEGESCQLTKHVNLRDTANLRDTSTSEMRERLPLVSGSSRLVSSPRERETCQLTRHVNLRDQVTRHDNLRDPGMRERENAWDEERREREEAWEEERRVKDAEVNPLKNDMWG